MSKRGWCGANGAGAKGRFETRRTTTGGRLGNRRAGQVRILRFLFVESVIFKGSIVTHGSGLAGREFT